MVGNGLRAVPQNVRIQPSERSATTVEMTSDVESSSSQERHGVRSLQPRIQMNKNETLTRTDVEQALRIARAYAADCLPWFAPALYHARLVVTEQCPSLAAVDRWMRVYFHPLLVGELLARKRSLKDALPELGWLWFHEVAHCVREHGQRAVQRNAEHCRWNLAADLEINDAQLMGLTPPVLFPPVFPRKFNLEDGELAEFYYDRLPPLR